LSILTVSRKIKDSVYMSKLEYEFDVCM